MHRPKTLFTTGIALVAALALPAAASAKQQSGTVLKVDRAHHAVEIVTPKHVVRRYSAPGKLIKRLKPQTAVVYSTAGKKVVKLRAKGHARKVAFYAKVVASGRSGVVLRLADGRRVKLGGGKKKRAHNRAAAAGSVTVNIQGLKVGQIVLITQTVDSSGNVTITIRLVQVPDANGGEDQDVVGTVTAIADDGSTLTIQTDSGDSMTFQTDSDIVDGIAVGDLVDVAYYQDTDGSLVADDVSSADDGSGDGGEDQLATGTVTGVAPDGSSITVAVDGGGAMTFQTDPDLIDGIAVGDVVDVSYYQDTDGSFVADDVSPVDDSSGDGWGDGSNG
jgi:hypothetical protein